MKCFIIVFFAQFRQFSRICALQTPQNEHNIDFSAQFDGGLLPFYGLLAQGIDYLHLVESPPSLSRKASGRKIRGFASSGRQSLIGRFRFCLYPTHRRRPPPPLCSRQPPAPPDGSGRRLSPPCTPRSSICIAICCILLTRTQVASIISAFFSLRWAISSRGRTVRANQHRRPCRYLLDVIDCNKSLFGKPFDYVGVMNNRP